MGSPLALAHESKVIGGVTYIVSPLMTRAALRVACRLLKMTAPAFGDVASLRAAAGAIGRLLSSLSADLDDETLWAVAEEFAKATRFTPAGGKELLLADVVDLHFQGRLVELIQWFRFAAEVTYGPLGAWLQQQAAAEARSTDPAEKPPAAG